MNEDHAGRGAQVSRVLQVAEKLRRSQYTVLELAKKFGVEERLIRRDLAAIERAGLPLYDERDGLGKRRWRILQ